MRLIDADAEVERLKKDYCEECTRKGNYGIFGAACTPCWVMDAVEEFENATTIDAEPVRHGHWIPRNPDCRGYTEEFMCSECDASTYLHCCAKDCDYDFCPTCGAKMDEEEKCDSTKHALYAGTILL